MKHALIGHRGVGKSALLQRIAAYRNERGERCVTLDLDEEVERRSGKSASEIFSRMGEAEFRKVERAIFEEIARESDSSDCDLYVSLGAGFDPRLLPPDWRALWVRRETDRRGRIFVNSRRPRLNSSVTPLEEYLERFAQREAGYVARADDVLTLDEGLERADFAERAFFLEELKEIGGALTLLPENFRGNFEEWLARRLRWGIRWFELRDDLLDENQIARARAVLPAGRTLVSFRRAAPSAQLMAAVRAGVACDWPIEKGSCPFAEPAFQSLHERLPGQSLGQALCRLNGRAGLKAALPVSNFDELAEGHRWRQQDPERRTFLPHSPDGRWSWYRLLEGPRSPLAFIRESYGSGVDQPTLLQWIRRRATKGTAFAAVLGDPVAHSRTPLEQAEFFRALDAPVLAVRLPESEAYALDFLRELGLRWAAVTSPLKGMVSHRCAVRAPVAEALASVNTLEWRDGAWSGTNTDLQGFRAMIAGLELGKVAIWGGGGTLAMLKSVLPEAQAFSVRSRENRDPKGLAGDEFFPDSVVWAAPGDGVPPKEWRPRRVIDLNYFDDSPARAFAMDRGAEYISGLVMFRAQAEGQRAFWRQAKS